MSEISTHNFVLTVAEGKRLIARGVAALPCVKAALQSGLVIVCKGSTNAYVAEELLGEPIARGAYVMGRAVPATADTSGVFSGNLPEVVFVNGQRSDLSLKDAIAQTQRGDVIIKGANALNHHSGVAGVLIGHPEGGTVGSLIGTCYGRGVHLVIPVGLEKEIAADIWDLAKVIQSEPEVCRQGMPSLWPVQGEIMTELEALALLTGVQARQIGSGGLCGAEGGSWFAVWGTPEELAAATSLVESIQGEPPFGG